MIGFTLMSEWTHMKTLIFILFFLPAVILPQSAYRFYINNINLPLNNSGVLAAVNIQDPDPNISGSGGKLDNIVFLFSGGFFMSGYDGDSLWSNGVSTASLVEDYLLLPAHHLHCKYLFSTYYVLKLYCV